MRNPLLSVLRGGTATQRDLFPDLPPESPGLPAVTAARCEGVGCSECARACPTQAIAVSADGEDGAVALDRGLCIGCGLCTDICPTGTLAPDRGTRTAVRRRADLVLGNRLIAEPTPERRDRGVPFVRSLHVREVSTGCSATDLEVQAATNPIFDVARFGIHLVASPRHADALAVTGPVGRAMQEPLRRCYEAMAEPRVVLAVGTCAISGGVHRGGYAEADGVEAILPVDVYIPGCPPHPWSIIHGLLVAMGREEPALAGTPSAPAIRGARGRDG